jgi:hypothetical protein
MTLTMGAAKKAAALKGSARLNKIQMQDFHALDPSAVLHCLYNPDNPVYCKQLRGAGEAMMDRHLVT